MKKVLAMLLVGLMLLLSACNMPLVLPEGESGTDGSGDEGAGTEEVTRVLPQKAVFTVNGQETEVVFVWGENTCSFTAGDVKCDFVYDPADRSLSLTRTQNGETNVSENLCVFDEQDRVTSISVDGRQVIALSYEGEDVFADYVIESENEERIKVEVDRTIRKMQMAPFDDPERYVLYTENGDLYGDRNQTVYNYTYDKHGNIMRIDYAEGEAFALLTNSAEAMTKNWQRCPFKIALNYCGSSTWAVFAMDMMCVSMNV